MFNAYCAKPRGKTDGLVFWSADKMTIRRPFEAAQGLVGRTPIKRIDPQLEKAKVNVAINH
jgi:hypothetical protein